MGHDVPPRHLRRWLLHAVLSGHPYLRQPRRRAGYTPDRPDPGSLRLLAVRLGEQPSRVAGAPGPAVRTAAVHARPGHVQRLPDERVPAAARAAAAVPRPVHPAAGGPAPRLQRRGPRRLPGTGGPAGPRHGIRQRPPGALAARGAPPGSRRLRRGPLPAPQPGAGVLPAGLTNPPDPVRRLRSRGGSPSRVLTGPRG